MLGDIKEAFKKVREERKRLREAGVLEDLAEPEAKKPAHLQLSRLER